MKLTSKLLATGALALGALATTAPVTAQVQGNIATANVSLAIIGTNAFQTAYDQIRTTYAPQIEQSQAKQQQLTTLLQPFDTNGNGQLDEAELPAVQSSPNFTQIQTLEGEIGALNNQVNAGRIFAVEQILAQYPAALTEVTTQQNIVVVFQPDTLQFAAQGTDITGQVTAALNAKVPTAGIVPPAEWRPSRQTLSVFQDVQQTYLAIQVQQARQAAQQQQQQPSTQAPVGR